MQQLSRPVDIYVIDSETIKYMTLYFGTECLFLESICE